jgi:hypothetical protein
MKDLKIWDEYRNTPVPSNQECSKCGLSLEYNNHNEDKCDFVPIDWNNIEELTYVEDNMEGETDIKIRSGYNVWELVLIFNIMERMFKESTHKEYTTITKSNLHLFNKAKEEYERERN